MNRHKHPLQHSIKDPQLYRGNQPQYACGHCQQTYIKVVLKQEGCEEKLLSARGQRLGDMVAGTVLVSDEQLELSSVRTELAERPALEGHFRFHSAALAKLSDTDLQATEQLLDRWNNLKPEQREKLLEIIVVPLSHKLQVPAPDVSQRLLFLEDLLAAEIRRQQRGLA